MYVSTERYTFRQARVSTYTQKWMLNLHTLSPNLFNKPEALNERGRFCLFVVYFVL